MLSGVFDSAVPECLPLDAYLTNYADPQGAQRWVDAINLFTKAQRDYLKTTMSK
jgi:hypothetical protein